MRKLLAPALAALALAAGPAAAQPPPGDPRVRTLDYRPGAVVRVDGALRTATQVRFGPGETVRHVALGDADAWEAAPEGALLFLRPRVAGGPTNLLVTTDGPRGQRHYAFELVALADRRARGVLFALQFLYPDDEGAALAAALDTAAAGLEARVDGLRLQQAALEGPRNLAYELQGSTAIAPSEVSDNGRFTVLRFPAGRPLPAIFVVSPDGTERLAPFDVRGELLVVHETARRLRLRRGREVVCIFNLAPAAAVPAGRTASPEVERAVTGTAP